MPDRTRGRCPHCRWLGLPRMSRALAVADAEQHIRTEHPDRKDQPQ